MSTTALIFYFILLALFFTQVTPLTCNLPPVSCDVTQQVYTWELTTNDVYYPANSELIFKLAYTSINYEGIISANTYRIRLFGLAWCFNYSGSHNFVEPLNYNVQPTNGLFETTAVTNTSTIGRLVRYVFSFSAPSPNYRFDVTYQIRINVNPYVPIPASSLPTDVDDAFDPLFYNSPDFMIRFNNADEIYGYPVKPSHSVHTCPSSPSGSPSHSASVTRTPSISVSQTSSTSRTPSTSITPSLSLTASASRTPSTSVAPSTTNSRTPSASESVTPTRSRTPSTSISRTSSTSVTPSMSRTPSTSISRTSSTSVTPTRSRTPSVSASTAPTATPSGSRTPSISKSVTASVSRTPSVSSSRTPSITPSRSGTSSVSASREASPSRTSSISASRNPSATASRSHSSTTTATASRSHSSTSTSTATASKSVPPSNSRTPSNSMTPSKSVAASQSSSPSPLPGPSVGIPLAPILNWNARVRLGKFGWGIMIGASELGLIPWDLWKSTGAPSKNFWTNSTTVPISIRLDVPAHDATFFYTKDSQTKSLVYNDNYLPAGFRRLGQTNNVTTIWCNSFGDAKVALTDIRLNGAPLCQDIVTGYNHWGLPYYVTVKNNDFDASTNGWTLSASLTFSWRAPVNLDDVARCHFLFGRTF